MTETIKATVVASKDSDTVPYRLPATSRFTGYIVTEVLDTRISLEKPVMTFTSYYDNGLWIVHSLDSVSLL